MSPLFVTLIIVGSVLFVLLILYFVLGIIFFKLTFSRRKGDKNFAEQESQEAKNEEDRVWFWKQNINELSIKSNDGLTLKGYYLNSNSNKLAILVHGYHGRYYSSVIQARMFFEHGFNVLLINNRAHDTSEGKTFSMSKKEAEDLKLWIDLMVKQNPNVQIALYGISMGAHIVMLEASKYTNKNVKCVIEDCGYTSLKDELLYRSKSSNIPFPKLFISSTSIYTRLFKGFSLNSDLRKFLPSLKTPSCLIHGEADDFVPFSNMKQIAESIENDVYKEVHPFKNCGHCKSMYQKNEYKKVLLNFVDKFIV